MIVIVLDPHEECADESDDTGLTEEAYTAIVAALAPYGDIVDVGEQA
jgi:hypothetical protein